DDIENRIGELFTENLKGQFREVITLDDVDQAIATMGAPDDIIDGDEQPRKPAPKQAKKLYRNPDNKVLGGVAGGLAAYWGISPLLIRIGFALLSFYYGIFIIVYIILWIAVPKAKTTKQKLEMKGENINVSNIERSIKDEYQEIKNGKGAAFMNRVGEGLCEVFTMIGKVLAIIIGVALFAGGIFMLFAFLSTLFLPNLYPWKSGFMELAYAFTPLNFILGKIAISFLIGIPIIMIIYMAIKLLFSFKSNNKVIALSALSCWMMGLVMLIVVGISEGRSWSIKVPAMENRSNSVNRTRSSYL
ncbi:MAG: PspC domain-containing protein, partial [Butyricimonas faecihominis]